MHTDTKTRDTAFIRVGKRIRPRLNRWIASRSLLPADQPTIPADALGWTRLLRENWRDIQRECDQLLAERDAIPPFNEISPYHRKVAPDAKWRSFFFEAHNYHAPANRERCPRTAAVIDQIPDLVTAFYSVMDPGTVVPRHKGITKALLNVHLGLRIPGGVDQCRIEIGDEVHGWNDGELLIIDDTFPHAVWNNSGSPRALLFMQVLRPMTPSARLLGKLIVELMAHTTYIREARRRLNAKRVRRRRAPNRRLG